MRKYIIMITLGLLLFVTGTVWAVDLNGKWLCTVVADLDHIYEYNMVIDNDKYKIYYEGNVAEYGTLKLDGNVMHVSSSHGGTYTHKFEMDESGEWFSLTTANGHSEEYYRDDE